MKHYLKIPWMDGTDAEYHRFNSLEDAFAFIKTDVLDSDGSGEYVLSSEPMDIPENDYDWHPEDESNDK